VSEPGLEDQVAQAELVRLALTTLPPKFRDCLLLQVEGKLSRREIAEVTGLGEKSVSVYLSGARKAFLQAYQRLEHEQDVPERRNTD
jgi:DNA-directed RNA polymerase specialized sigma24 family protein